MRFSLMTTALTILLCALEAPAVHAASSYPSHLIRLIVGFPAGSATDINARIVADGLSHTLKQDVIVENMPGAGGMIALDHVLRSKADGYTLLVTPPSFAINNIVYKAKGSDPALWTPVSLLATVPYLLDARPTFPGSTIKDLITLVKAHPDKFTYASGGIGSSAQLAALLISERAGIKMTHVPYRGAAPALEAVMAGHVDIVFDALATSLPYWKSHAIKVLGVADTKRSPFMPSVPTISESGLPGVDLTTWTAIVAPPKTPMQIADKLSGAIHQILEQPQTKAKMEATHQDVVGYSPERTKTFLAHETQTWGKIARDANITLD